MTVGTVVTGVGGATQALKEMVSNPWSYFPNLVGGDLVGLGQVGPSRFLVAFGKTWSGGTPSQTDPPTFSSPEERGPRVFDVDTGLRQATEITPSLLLSPNASLRAAVMAGSGMHLIASTSTGTHAQFVQNFAHQTIRSLDAKPLSPASWSNGIEHVVEWDRGAAAFSRGFFAVGADMDNQLYLSRVTTLYSQTNGYDPSRRSYLSDKGWTPHAKEQTPLRRAGGSPLLSSVPVALRQHRQWWYMLLPQQTGGTWGWEVLRASSLISPFRHVSVVQGEVAGPTVARFFPGIALETDGTQPPGVAWSYTPETPGSLVPRLGQLVI